MLHSGIGKVNLLLPIGLEFSLVLITRCKILEELCETLLLMLDGFGSNKWGLFDRIYPNIFRIFNSLELILILLIGFPNHEVARDKFCQLGKCHVLAGWRTLNYISQLDGHGHARVHLA
jgi:hypothetical protein